MKIYLSILSFLFYLNTTNAQVSTTFSFKNKQLEKKDKKWLIADKNRPKKYFEVDCKIITVKFKTSLHEGLDKLKGKFNIKLIRKASTGYIDIEIPQGYDILQFAKILQGLDYIQDVDINAFGEYGAFTPNDTYYNYQWYLSKTQVPYAWDFVQGNSCIVVAIIDSGTDWLHEDLGNGTDNFNNIWHNSGEDTWNVLSDPTTGNSVDDDGNGFIDDWIGWDFANQDNNSKSTINSHGTQVSGIVSAKTNNNAGIAGIAGGNNSQGVVLMPLLVGDESPIGSVIDDAILYAVNNGADVIQMSLGALQSNAIDTAIQVAENANVTLICASGNNYSSSVNYPASNVNVIAVGSTNQNDQKSDFSNYGSNLFIAAPGEDIYSTTLSNNYGYGDGTSFAAPQVSATVALMKQINPILSNPQIRNVLQNSADKVGGYTYTSGRSNELGYGRLNTNEAVNAAKAIYPPISGPDLVCSSGSSFSVDKPAGYTISWEKSSNLSRSSSQGSNPCTFAASGSREGWIEAVIITTSNDSITLPRKEVWVGVPDHSRFEAGATEYALPQQEIHEICNEGQTLIEVAYDEDGTGTNVSSWSKYYSFLEYEWDFSSDWEIEDSYFSGLPYESAYIEPSWGAYPQAGDYEVIKVRGRNTCGWSEWHANSWEIIDCGGWYMMASPNPANDYIEVSFFESAELSNSEKSSKTPIKPDIETGNKELAYEVQLWNEQGMLLKQKSNHKKLQLQTGNLNPGAYFLHVLINGETYKQQIMVTH